MKDRVNELITIIQDLSEKNEKHPFLRKHEFSAVKILKIVGELSFNMFIPSDSINDKVRIDYSSIKKHLVELYIDIVLINTYLGSVNISSLKLSGRMENLEELFGIRVTLLLQNSVVAMLNSVERDDMPLFEESLKLVHSLILGVLHMYRVEESSFYDDVEEHVFEILSQNALSYYSLTANKLKKEFNGKKLVVIDVKMDRRRKNPFIGFISIIKKEKVEFLSETPYKAFLDLTNYINESTKYKDVKLVINAKTKSFLNRYSIMYAKEDKLVDTMDEGFYPVLVPKGVTDVEGFLAVLI